MKKTLLVALTLITTLFLGSVAQALSLPMNVRAQLHVTPANLHSTHNKNQVKTIQILVDGTVLSRVCTLGSPNLGFTGICVKKVLGELNTHEMDRIERDIQEANEGRTIHPDPRAVCCRAVPIERAHYTADNGRVFLQDGFRPCALATYNDAPAAKKLVETLDQFYYNLLIAAR